MGVISQIGPEHQLMGHSMPMGNCLGRPAPWRPLLMDGLPELGGLAQNTTLETRLGTFSAFPFVRYLQVLVEEAWVLTYDGHG